MERSDGLAEVPASLLTLSLDAAVELDRLESRRDADLSILKRFVACLETGNGSHPNEPALRLVEDPLNMDVFSRAIHRVNAALPEQMSELEESVSRLVQGIKRVANGEEATDIPTLRQFCLSLHEAILREHLPVDYDDDWAGMRNGRLS